MDVRYGGMVIYPQLHDFNGVREREERELVRKLAAEMVQRTRERPDQGERLLRPPKLPPNADLSAPMMTWDDIKDSDDTTENHRVYLSWVFHEDDEEAEGFTTEELLRAVHNLDSKDPDEMFRLWLLQCISRRGHSPVTDSTIGDFIG